jgi:hypothetical protein
VKEKQSELKANINTWPFQPCGLAASEESLFLLRSFSLKTIWPTDISSTKKRDIEQVTVDQITGLQLTKYAQMYVGQMLAKHMLAKRQLVICLLVICLLAKCPLANVC